jgi:hypothetical protein
MSHIVHIAAARPCSNLRHQPMLQSLDPRTFTCWSQCVPFWVQLRAPQGVMYNMEGISRIGRNCDLVALLATVWLCESKPVTDSHCYAPRNHPRYMVFLYYFLLVRFGKKFLAVMPSGYNFSGFLSSDQMAKLIGLLVSCQSNLSWKITCHLI